MYKYRRIALTGATSTLGTAIIRECITNHIEVIAFVNKGSINEGRVPNNKLVTKVYCTLEEMRTVNVEGISADAFFHMAWTATNRMVRNDLEPQICNIKWALDSVVLAKKLGCYVYVGAGSQAEYGRTNDILTETLVTNPETAYGIAKLCAGQMTRLECERLGIRHVWPRILSTYGPNTQDSTIINYTINCLLHGKSPSLTACEQVWDFLYVDDAAKALMLLAEKGKDKEVYIVSSGCAFAMKEYIEIIREKMTSNVTIGYGDVVYNNQTVMHLQGDISKLRRDTGFVPSIDFNEGIERTIEWAKEYYK